MTHLPCSSELYGRITQLESILRANNLSEVNIDTKSSKDRFSGIELMDSGNENDSEEFVRKISVLKFQIYDLEKENETLRAAVNDQKTRTLSAERMSKVATESLHQNVTELDEKLTEAVRARKDIERQLREEREMFMVSEDRMRTEIETLKEEMVQCNERWQEERELFIEQERKMNRKITKLEQHDISTEICHRSNSSMIQALEIEKLNLNDQVTSLSARIDSLECMKINLENENAQLLREIRKDDNLSDTKETTKDKKDSKKEHLKEKVEELESDLERKDNKMKEMQKESKGLQGHIEELYNELDEVNQILANEREKRKNLELEALEFKKKERVYENAIAASMEGNEKRVLSNSTRKRGERWNNDVVELRKKVEELERKNRELSNAMDRREYSVEAIKQGFESKLLEVGFLQESINHFYTYIYYDSFRKIFKKVAKSYY